MATIKDIASKSGVSVGSISRYLNGIHLKKENEEKIKQAIKELHYIPNQTAKSLKMNKSFSIGILVDNIDGEKLFLLADQGDKLAQDLIDKVYSFLAIGLYNIEVAFDFDALIIGGGISAHKGFSSELYKRLYAELVKNKVSEIMPEVKECQYHNNANLYGAAYNFISDYAIEVKNGNN